MSHFEYFPEKKYQEILKEVGAYRYQVFDKNEKMPGDVFPIGMPFPTYTNILAGTGDTASDYTFTDCEPRFTLPKGAQLIVARLLRYDYNRGNPHYNADDYLIFLTQEGNVFRMKRSHAPDHFIRIIDLSQVKPIAEAFHLPDEKAGPVENYGSKGASLHIQLEELGQSPFISR